MNRSLLSLPRRLLATASKTYKIFHVDATTSGALTTAQTGGHTLFFDEPVKIGGTDKGPNPLQTALAAVAGCENVLAKIVAKEMNFQFSSLDFAVDGEIDVAGLYGQPGVPISFQVLRVKAKLGTTESEARIREFTEKVEARCPIMQLFVKSGTKVEASWERI
jgi:uncharacterized OsmC-like protein